MQTFKMAWGKGVYFSLAYTVVVFIPLIWATCSGGAFSLTAAIAILLCLVSLMQWFALHKNRYIITDSDIIVKNFGEKARTYPIDKITRIEYVDLGTDWMKTPPNSRYQLAIWFDRKYIKSVEPRRFGPVDREGFVEAILKINPSITVEGQETATRPSRYPNIG